jgi:hypothetical protein
VIEREPLYHVTRIDGRDLYGHNECHCDASGCAGDELYLGTSAEEVKRGDLVRPVADYQVEIAEEVTP